MATCYNRYTRQYYYCQSRWSSWGRWVALGVILVAAFILFFIIACISQRRRRKQGAKPYYGTGWTYKLPGGGGQQYNPQYNQQQSYQAPPTYNQNQGYNQSAPQGGYYGGNNNTGGGAAQSYFGGQRNDPEMQAPQNAYNSGSGYAPPAGPPPGKNY